MRAVIRCALAATAAAILLPVGVQAGATPDFSGKWSLDSDRSDDAEAVIKTGLGVTEKTTGRPNVPEMRTADRLVALSRALTWLEIRQSDKDFRIYDDADNARIYYIDGKKHARETPWGAKLQTVTSWEDGKLHMRTEGKDIGDVDKVDETYDIEGGQLVFLVRIKLKVLKDDVVVRSYYNRVQE
jgi:hypothetical protein